MKENLENKEMALNCQLLEMNGPSVWNSTNHPLVGIPN